MAWQRWEELVKAYSLHYETRLAKDREGEWEMDFSRRLWTLTSQICNPVRVGFDVCRWVLAGLLSLLTHKRSLWLKGTLWELWKLLAGVSALRLTTVRIIHENRDNTRQSVLKLWMDGWYPWRFVRKESRANENMHRSDQIQWLVGTISPGFSIWNEIGKVISLISSVLWEREIEMKGKCHASPWPGRRQLIVTLFKRWNKKKIHVIFSFPICFQFSSSECALSFFLGSVAFEWQGHDGVAAAFTPGWDSQIPHLNLNNPWGFIWYCSYCFVHSFFLWTETSDVE